MLPIVAGVGYLTYYGFGVYGGEELLKLARNKIKESRTNRKRIIANKESAIKLATELLGCNFKIVDKYWSVMNAVFDDGVQSFDATYHFDENDRLQRLVLATEYSQELETYIAKKADSRACLHGDKFGVEYNYFVCEAEDKRCPGSRKLLVVIERVKAN